MLNKRFLKKSLSIAVLALMLAAASGCEKKAESIVDDESAVVETTESSNVSADTSSNEDTTVASAVESTTVEPYTWTEKINGNGSDFVDFDIKVKIKGKAEENTNIFTVRTDDYNNPEFIKELCEKVFGGTEEVYDYKTRTKRIVDADLEMYNCILTMYQDEDAGIHFPKNPGAEDPTPEDYENTKKQVQDKIAELEEERNTAPDKVENDYSYGGYIGQINGEEYYMYLGNRNFEEYPEAPLTTQFDGRVVTIFKKDHTEFFDGGIVYYVDMMPTGWKGKDADVPDDMVAEAQEFVNSIGFSEYKFNGEKSDGFFCQKGLLPSVFGELGLPESYYPTGREGFSGYTAMFTLGGEDDRTLGLIENDINTCCDNCDAMQINSYILVGINENGIIGAVMVNPVSMVDSEQVQIMSDEDAKNIIVENINDLNAWNIPVENPAKSLDINQLKLVSFPVKSEKDEHEYTYVPAYVFTHMHQYGEAYLTDIASGYSNYYSPVMVINAVDGTFINIKDNLGSYYKGYTRGNEGYNELFNGNWERYRKQVEQYEERTKEAETADE